MSRPTPVRHALLLPLYLRRERISADAVIPGSDAPHNAPSLSRYSNIGKRMVAVDYAILS